MAVAHNLGFPRIGGDRELKKAGWRVVRMWEHELKVPAKVAA